MSIVVAPSNATTALTIIKRALRLLGVYSTGEEPSPDEAQDGLDALNALGSSLSNDSLLVHSRTLDSISLTAGVASIAVGPSGDTITDRPVKVLPESYIELGGVSYPLEVLTLAQYSAIGVKDVQGVPRGVYAQMDVPDVTLSLYPVPGEAMTLKLWSQKVFRSFTSLTTEVQLPPGYDRMLAFMLAEEIAPEYEREPSPTVRQKAASARRSLKRTNAEVPQLDVPYGVPGHTGFRDIREF